MHSDVTSITISDRNKTPVHIVLNSERVYTPYISYQRKFEEFTLKIKAEARCHFDLMYQ